MGFEVINKIKKEKGLTNAQIAQMAGVTLSTLDKITAGINTNPKLDTLQAICRVLGCRLDDFDDSPKSTKRTSFTTEDLKHLDKYHALDDHGKDVVDTVLDKEHARVADEYIEIAARGGKYKVKRDSAVEWAKNMALDQMEEDDALC